MKHKSLLFALVAASLLLGTADAFAQRSSRAQHSAQKSGSASNASMTPRSHYNPALVKSETQNTKPNRYYRETFGEKATNDFRPSYCVEQKVYLGTDFEGQFLTPNYGKEVSERTATRKSQAIRNLSGEYYYRDGIFYLHDKDKYVIHAPNIGFRVANVPSNCRKYDLNETSYYYYYGTFYTLDSSTNEYVVVVPPKGALVEWIPKSAERLDIEGDTYYFVDGVQYKTLSYDGKKWYEVVFADEKLYSQN